MAVARCVMQRRAMRRGMLRVLIYRRGRGHLVLVFAPQYELDRLVEPRTSHPMQWHASRFLVAVFC